MKKRATLRLMIFLMLVGGAFLSKASPVPAAYVSAVTGLAQSGAGKDSVTLTWTPAEGAAEYRVYYKEAASDSDFVLSGATAGASYTIKGLKDGVKYFARVKSFDGERESASAALYDVVTLPAKIEGLKQESWYYFVHVLNLKWERKSGVSGYEVILADSKGKKLKKKNVSYPSVSFEKLKDSVYTVKVRAYTDFQNRRHYSAYSSVNCIPQARISKLKIKGGKLSMSWNKVSGATGYKIYVSTKEKKGYKLVKTLGKSKKSFALSKFKGKKINPKKTYYAYVQTVCKKGKKKGTSGVLYYWSTKNNSFGYL